MAPSTHPTAADLAAFALGTLDPGAAYLVQRHLADCAPCRSIAEQTPADSLVGLLRQGAASGPANQPATASYPGPDGETGALTPPEVPQSLRDHPRYRILRFLGSGGMGVVFQAEHRVMERLVAIKVINRALVSKSETIERFHREVRAAAKLDHPNIVKAYDAEQAGDLQLLAMEFVEGKSLADVLNKKGPLPIANACNYVRQAALGLQHAFAQGLVHRDLKPHNLMLTPKGVVKILDFGLAKMASEQARPGVSLTQENEVMGTPEYMAPEQAIDTRSADIRADIYALGCTLYSLLAGRPPFAGDPLAVMVAQAQDPPPPIESLRPDVPPELAALISRLLTKDPAGRLQTPKELAEALLPFAKAPRRVLTAFVAPSVLDPTRRWLAPAVIAAVLLIGICTTGILLSRQTKNGVVTLQGSPPDAAVSVEQGSVVLTRLGDTNSKDRNRATGSAPAGRRGLQPEKKLLTADLGAGATMDFVRIPAGTFLMGSPEDEKQYVTKNYLNDIPDSLKGETQHEVTITRPFYLGTSAVTVGQFKRFVQDTGYRTDAESSGNGANILVDGAFKRMKDGNWHNPGFAQADDCPVTCVSWNDAVKLCEWLSRRDKKKYRLPTEAEWELACRGGRPPSFAFGIGDGRSLSSELANFDGRQPYGRLPKGTYLGRTKRVGAYPPNAYGLYDMQGNVMQWCSDRYDIYPPGRATDPTGSETGQHRAARGGGWYSYGWYCRAAYRHDYPPGYRLSELGFRVVRVISNADG